MVVITIRGRDGKSEGLGTGFVLSREGLIATNLHVIGEGRALSVETADGTQHEVTAIHATDRANDLAIVRVKATGLVPLPLGDAGALRDGQPVVAIGNPKGLKHSVVSGVVSGRRNVDGRSMIQVAIPIEPGNSGGPLLDRAGRVVGIMTIKSLVTANLGFAVASNALRPLLARPNPIPLAGWITIGALDPEDWQPRGGQWRQRAGRIIAEGRGPGVGGRAFCLSTRKTPEPPFEVAVTVRLDDEAGAAGLVFHADGGDRHYGFYPSNGQMRLAAFNGPDVFQWRVLGQKSSPHYRPGEWNTLRVRIDKGGRIRCLVNDELVYEITDDTFTAGQVGLAKFRETVAEFKQLRVGATVPSARPAAALLTRVSGALDGVGEASTLRPETLARFPRGNAETLAAVREQARRLERQAQQLRKVAVALHEREVLTELGNLMKAERFDLAHAALLLARLDNDELDVEHYRGEVERMARKIASGLPPKASDTEKLAALERYLFRDKGFHGSRGDYYNRSNSYLSEVIDDREGLPITLSLLYLDLARRLGVQVEGVGLPGHFVVRHVPKGGGGQLIDVYEGGVRLSRKDAERIVRERGGRDLEEADLAAVPGKRIILRMVHNLLSSARKDRDEPAMLRYLDTIIILQPDAAEERGVRAALRYQAGDVTGAREDLDWLLDNRPEGIDLDRVEKMRRFLDRDR
ncbi:MAG: tetratricopeptide repeat protein [Gemmataceae bacterium]